MTRRNSHLDEEPPADSYTVGRLTFWEEPLKGGASRCYAKIWRGKSKRPKYYTFRSPEARQEWVERETENDAKVLRIRQEWKDKAKKEAEEMRRRLQVGSILHYSWGYDQTNCEFFQVVKTKGWYVWIRPIGAETVPKSEGFMSERLMPRRDAFIGEEIRRKKITSSGVSMDYGSASPVHPEQSFYSSHYA